MSDHPTFRVVDPIEPPPPRRGPGIAVVAVATYALLFMGALWYFKRDSGVPKPQSGVAPPASSRADLLAGAGLATAARASYLRRIAADHCDCGCDLTLEKCLAQDRSCVRSPELARQRLRVPAP